MMFRSARSRWSWQRCFDYPWIPRCQRLFRRMHERRLQMNTNQFHPFETNTNHQPFQPNIRRPPPPNFRFRGQTSPGNVRLPTPRFPGAVPDLSRIQPVCNVRIFQMAVPPIATTYSLFCTQNVLIFRL